MRRLSSAFRPPGPRRQAETRADCLAAAQGLLVLAFQENPFAAEPLALLEAEGVACMPGESFGSGLAGWLRISLTQPDAVMDEAAARTRKPMRRAAKLPYGGVNRIRFEGTVSTVAGTPASTVIVAENGWRRAAVCEQGLPRPKVA